MSNAVSDSLERCRQAFRLIVEGEEEEDYLVKASRYQPEEPMDPDPVDNVDASTRVDYPLLADLEDACGKCVANYQEGEIAVDTIEQASDPVVEKYFIQVTASDSSIVDRFISDLEYLLRGKFSFLVCGVKSEASKSVSGSREFSVREHKQVTAVIEASSTDSIGESKFTPYKQKRVRDRKPKQIKKAARFARPNKFIKRVFRRKWFAKRKFLLGK